MSFSVNYNEIEKQLRLYQHDLSPNEARTSLFNLVVFAPESRLPQTTIGYLMGKRPSRVILVNTDRKGEASVHVSARCVEDSELKQVCIQEILISSGKDGGGENPAAWSPLLLKGIPTFLWYRGELPPKAGELLSAVEDHVDRIFVDSSLGGSVLEFLGSYRSLHNPLPLSDFTWSRIFPLMKLSAQLFNPLEMRPVLHELTQVTFKGGLQAEAMEFFLWFASRMDWKVTQDPKSPWQGTNSSGKPVKFLHSDPGPLENGFALEFKCPSSDVSTLVSDKDGFAICTPCRQKPYTAVFNLPQDGEILLKEVDQCGSDRLFWEALPN